MIREVRAMAEGYAAWLRDSTHLREITTPYLDRRNDHFQIHARFENGHVLLTDDGYVLADLKISGGGTSYRPCSP